MSSVLQIMSDYENISDIIYITYNINVNYNIYPINDNKYYNIVIMFCKHVVSYKCSNLYVEALLKNVMFYIYTSKI